MQSHEISKGHHYRVSLQIMFNDIQPHLARKEMKFCGNKMGTDKAKRKRLSVDIQLLSRFTRTQTRGRTGMDVTPLVFETSASTDSAIWACLFFFCVAKVNIIFISAIDLEEKMQYFLCLTLFRNN